MRLRKQYYQRDALEVAPNLLGCLLLRKYPDGHIEKAIIAETEAYKGEEDLASHARFGKTPRNQVMYLSGGLGYVYLIYGMYWMLNIVTGKVNDPQAVLIRSLTLENSFINGPGRVGKILQLDKSFYGEELDQSSRLWIEKQKSIDPSKIFKSERIGIDYALEWAKKKWRFSLIMGNSSGKH